LQFSIEVTNSFLYRGEELVKAGDPIDFLGILVSGGAFVLIDNKNMKDLRIGDMIGHMFAADLNQRETHLTTIIATTDGNIAVLPFGEIK
jgi:CRP-like cAMP-binding protein